MNTRLAFCAESSAFGDARSCRAWRRQRATARAPAAAAAAAAQAAASSSSTAASHLDCSHFEECSGCSRHEHLDLPAQFLDAQGFFRSLGLEQVPMVAGPAHGWRRRAKLAVRGEPGRLQIGLFRERSHEVVPVPECRAHHLAINEAVALVQRVAEEQGVPPFREDAPPTRAGVRPQRPSAGQATGAGGKGKRAAPGRGARREQQQQQQAPRTAAGQEALGLLRYLQLTVVSATLQPPAEHQQSLGARPPWPPTPMPSPGQLYGSPGQQDHDGSHAQVQLVLVVCSPGPQDAAAEKTLTRLARTLWERAGPPPGARPASPAATRERHLLHSVWVNYQPAVGTNSNAVFGRQWRLLHGPRHVWEAWGGVPCCLAPGSFVQANYGAFASAIGLMRAALPPGARHMVEMHAGVGAIGLSLTAGPAAGFQSLRCVEINPEAEAPFQTSVQALPPGHTRLVRTEYCVAAAGSRPAAFLAGADVVVVDPPRKGLEPALLEALVNLAWDRAPAPAGGPAPGTRRLLYLSCGWEALKRDVATLLALAPAGGSAAAVHPRPAAGYAWVRQAQAAPARWRLVSASALLFFPGTDSIETLVVLEEDVPRDANG